MSARTLIRHFQRTTGSTPHQSILRERLLAALRLLEAGDEPIEQIVARTGLGTAANLRQTFRREFGIAPHAYRTRYRSG